MNAGDKSGVMNRTERRHSWAACPGVISRRAPTMRLHMTDIEEKKEHHIPRTGIQVMNDLSLDARTVIFLAHEGFLIPYLPAGMTKQHFMRCMSSHSEPPES